MKTFKWLWTSLIFAWLVGASTTAQTTIWSEDFESYSDEYTGSGMDLNSGDAGSDWTHTAANALVAKVDDDDVAIINGTYSYKVRQTNGWAWTTESIDITSFVNVSISLTISERNADNDGIDVCETWYSLDDGPYIEFGDGNGDGTFGSVTNTVAFLNGNTLRLRITSTANHIKDHHFFDDIVIQTQTVLPVTWLEVNAKTVNRKVQVAWSTASETNNDYFTVEKSADGLRWNAVREVRGAGHSSTTLHYAYTDPSPFASGTYYRVKQTDFNGEYDHSPTVYVPGPDSPDALVVYPNPVVDHLRVKSTNPFAHDIVIRSSMGRVLQTVAVPAGALFGREIDVSGLAPGVYAITDGVRTGKFVKYR